MTHCPSRTDCVSNYLMTGVEVEPNWGSSSLVDFGLKLWSWNVSQFSPRKLLTHLNLSYLVKNRRFEHLRDGPICYCALQHTFYSTTDLIINCSPTQRNIRCACVRTYLIWLSKRSSAKSVPKSINHKWRKNPQVKLQEQLFKGERGTEIHWELLLNIKNPSFFS